MRVFAFALPRQIVCSDSREAHRREFRADIETMTLQGGSQRSDPASKRFHATKTRSRNRWSVLAELYRAYEGQPVERRFVSLRSRARRMRPRSSGLQLRYEQPNSS